jgi:hypothetical protein
MQEALVEFLLEDGGLAIIGLISGGLFVAQAIFTFIIWRKGDKSYFIPFLSYLIAATAMIGGSISFIGILIDYSYQLEDFMFIFFIITAIAAAALQIYNFIIKNWISKEGKA